jgi:hypothetical protein
MRLKQFDHNFSIVLLWMSHNFEFVCDWIVEN